MSSLVCPRSVWSANSSPPLRRYAVAKLRRKTCGETRFGLQRVADHGFTAAWSVGSGPTPLPESEAEVLGRGGLPRVAGDEDDLQSIGDGGTVLQGDREMERVKCAQTMLEKEAV